MSCALDRRSNRAEKDESPSAEGIARKTVDNKRLKNSRKKTSNKGEGKSSAPFNKLTELRGRKHQPFPVVSTALPPYTKIRSKLLMRPPLPVSPRSTIGNHLHHIAPLGVLSTMSSCMCGASSKSHWILRMVACLGLHPLSVFVSWPRAAWLRALPTHCPPSDRGASCIACYSSIKPQKRCVGL